MRALERAGFKDGPTNQKLVKMIGEKKEERTKLHLKHDSDTDEDDFDPNKVSFGIGS